MKATSKTKKSGISGIDQFIVGLRFFHSQIFILNIFILTIFKVTPNSTK